MGVTHGKKKDHNLHHFPVERRKHMNGPVQTTETHVDGRESGESMKPAQELQALPPQGQDEEENGNLIRPKKLPHPLTSSKSHQQLHKELKMTHNRGVCKEKKTELQLVLERRNCEQRLKQRRHQEETQRSRSPLQQELLKRQQRLDKLERDQRDRPEDPEFLRVKERLRRTTTLDMGGKDV